MGRCWMWILQLQPKKDKSPAALSLLKGITVLGLRKPRICSVPAREGKHVWGCGRWHWLFQELPLHRKETNCQNKEVARFLIGSCSRSVKAPFCNSSFLHPCPRTPETYLWRCRQCPPPRVASGRSSAVTSDGGKVLTATAPWCLGCLISDLLLCLFCHCSGKERISWSL